MKSLYLILSLFTCQVSAFADAVGFRINLPSNNLTAGCVYEASVDTKTKEYYDSYFISNFPNVPAPEREYYIAYTLLIENSPLVWSYEPLSESAPPLTPIHFNIPRKNSVAERSFSLVAKIVLKGEMGTYWDMGIPIEMNPNVSSNFNGIVNFTLEEPFYFSGASHQIIQEYYLNVIKNPSNSYEFGSVIFENSWSLTSGTTQDELRFVQTKCGTYPVVISGSFTCLVTNHLTQFADKIEFEIEAPQAVLQNSVFPNDKSRLVSNLNEGIAYQWLRQSIDGTWEVLFASVRGSLEEMGNYKIRNFPLVPGCGHQESVVFSPSTTELRGTHVLETTILNRNIKSIEDLTNPSFQIGKDYNQSLSYSDEIGRPVYSTVLAAGSGGEDIAQHFEYDEWGRQKKTFLPYVFDPTQLGDRDAQAAPNQLTFYQTHPDVAHDSSPFSTTTFDDPRDLSKIMKVFGAGQAWLSADKFSSQDGYLYKASDFSVNPVYRLIWGIPGGGWAEKALTDNNDPNHQTYWDQELMVKESKSEDNQFTYEFINHLGQTVATRLMSRGPTEKPLTTYYVYDDFGRLRIKIPPKVSNHFGNTASILYSGNNFLQLAPDLSSQMGPLVIALCTRYEYDNLGRLITEYKPGGGYVETVYDLLNRPIMSQDQSQRLNDANKWSFVKYDRMGRKVMTGEINFPGTANKTRNNLQTDADDANIWFEKPADDQNAVQGYSNLTFPVLDTEISTILTVDYFDGYDFKRGNEASANPFNPAADLEWNTTVLGAQPNLCADLRDCRQGTK